MGDFDVAAKVLLQEQPEDVARLVLGKTPIVRLAADDAVIPGVERRLDKLLRIELEGERELRLHVEVEARPNAETPKRTFRYWSQVHEQHEEVFSLVIYLQRGSKQGYPTGRYTKHVLGREVVAFSFQVVRMWEVGAETLLKERVLGLLPLLPFADGATAEHVRRAMQTLSEMEPLRKRAELQAALAMVAGNVFPQTNWLATIPKEVLMASTTVEQLLAQGRAEGLKKGREQGREEGREEGREQGKVEAHRTSVMAVLTTRFGEVPVQLVEALERLREAEALEALVRRAASVSSLDEFQAALPPLE